MLVSDDAVEVAGKGAYVAIDGPLVVVEHHDHPLGLFGDVVHRFKRNSIGEGRIAGHGDHVLLAASQVAGHGHSQCSRERGACVAGSITIVLALGAQHKAVQPARLANGIQAVQPPGEYLVDVRLVTDIEEQLVFRGIEDRVQSQRQFHHSQVRAQMTTGLREGLNQEFADLPRQFSHLCEVQSLEIGGRVDGLQQCSHVLPSPGKGRDTRKKPPDTTGLSRRTPPTASIPTRQIRRLSD